MTLLSLSLAARDPAVAARPALFESGVALSFAELAARADRVRARLVHEGARPGARIALVAANHVATVIAIHALIDLGVTLVPIHPRLSAAEAAVLIEDAAPHRVLRDDDLGALVAEAEVDVAPPPIAAIDPEAPLAMIYTSGTTGRPKGAILARRAFLAGAAASAENLGFLDDDRWLLAMPLCHVGGLSILTRCLIARRPVILEPRFDPDRVLLAVERDRATLLSVVPTMLAALLDRDDRGVLARLRVVLVGGAAAPPLLLAACGLRGIPAITTYGLTEACSQVTAQRLRSSGAPEAGSGESLPGVEVRVTPEAGAPPSDAGRIAVRGPTLMSGYWRGSDAPPDRAVDAEGWFETGDLGMLDAEGRLHVHARRTDLIVTGGENVYPVEIEQLLESLPGVRRALVFGIPDARWGQIVAAAVELDEGATPDAIAIEAAARLSPHKRPRRIFAVETLTLTSSGKLQRGGAAERYAGGTFSLADRSPSGDTPPQ